MSDGRLPAGIEVSGLIRRIETEGGHATVIRKGDSDRGSILLQISCRGSHIAFLERVLDPAGSYRWDRVGPGDSVGSKEIADFIARRQRFDEDMWVLELDIVRAEQFIAETIRLP